MPQATPALPFRASDEKRRPRSVETAQAEAFRQMEPAVCNLVHFARMLDFLSDAIADGITDEEKLVTADPRDILALQHGVTTLWRQLVELRDQWYLDYRKASTAPVQIHADERLLELHRKLQIASVNAVLAQRQHAAAETSQDGEDEERTETEFSAALGERAALIEQIAGIPAKLGEGLDVKLTALQALLTEEKMELDPCHFEDPRDKLAYSLARDVAMIRGAL